MNNNATSPAAQPGSSALQLAFANKSVFWGMLVIAIMVAVAWIGPDVHESTRRRSTPWRGLKPAGEFGLFGTDHLGRDLFSRVVNGARISLVIGFAVAAVAVTAGLLLGLVAGYFRLMDGGDHAAHGRVDVDTGDSPRHRADLPYRAPPFVTVIVAIVVPEVPRVVRLVRSVVLSVREEPYVEAGIAAGTPIWLILWRHILPNTIAPMIVQATYICGAAILTEAILGFLGAGIPPETPSWGNIMSEGRTFFQLTPWVIFFPGSALALTVLAVNFVGDGLRDTLDPRIARNLR